MAQSPPASLMSQHGPVRPIDTPCQPSHHRRDETDKLRNEPPLPQAQTASALLAQGAQRRGFGQVHIPVPSSLRQAIRHDPARTTTMRPSGSCGQPSPPAGSDPVMSATAECAKQAPSQAYGRRFSSRTEHRSALQAPQGPSLPSLSYGLVRAAPVFEGSRSGACDREAPSPSRHLHQDPFNLLKRSLPCASTAATTSA